MVLSDFIRFFPLRAKNMAWLFGAGTSVSAGIPSAYDLIWDFKKRIYCAEQGYSLQIYDNLSDSGIRNQIQSYFDSQTGCPAFDSPEEYSYYFERTFTSPKDRSEYISRQVDGLQLTYGHKIIGTLMKHGYLNLIFTTNFDKAFENAAVEQFKQVGTWFSTSLDDGDTGLRLFQSADKRPLVIKLHGDYLSEKLKNTSEELQEQDKKLRSILTIASYTNGLGIMGYSGRDQSIMNTLLSSLSQDNAFPHGVFWFIKSDTIPLPSVVDFIQQAKNKGIEAEIIEVETFDAAWGEIIKGFENLPKEDLDRLNRNYFRVNNRPLPQNGKRFPIIRLNAIKVDEFPATARLYKCEAGNTKEVREIVAQKKADVLVIRKRNGIVGFGADQEFQKAFEQYGSAEQDVYQIQTNTLLYDDSSIKGLLSEAIAKSLVDGKPLLNIKRRGKYQLIPNPKHLDLPVFSEIKKELSGTINGKIPKTNLDWLISLEINLQYKLSSAFLVVNPGIIAGKTTNAAERLLIAPFIKEYKARWYNNKYDSILTAWLNILFGTEKQISIQAFSEMGIGVNASFTISKSSAYTRIK